MSDHFVGRRREVAALRGWLDAAVAGAGCLVLCVGEAGIGKTRLAQELAGYALAGGHSVVWGRCAETPGAPPLWPWWQVLRELQVDADRLTADRGNAPEDRFRLLDEVSAAVVNASGSGGLLVVLDDVQWADEQSLLVLRHLADRLDTMPVLVLVNVRDGGVPAQVQRSPVARRIDVRGFDLAEVTEQLAMTAPEAAEADPGAVLDVTAGNPLFVREVARAIADGTWRPDAPPSSVLDVVGARLTRISPGCLALVQAAAVVGRDFSLPVLAAALAEPIAACLPRIDEARRAGLIDRFGDDFRFVHALTRDATEASMPTAQRVRLHRAVAVALADLHAADLTEHVADIARHWAELAPYGDAAGARDWAVLAAQDAVRRLAYPDAVRLYRGALAFDAPMTDERRCRLQVALGRACYLGGDLAGCVDAAVAAAAAASAADSPELAAEAALVLEAAPDPGVNTVAKRLAEQALTALPPPGHRALRSRLLALRSHLAFYAGDQELTAGLSRQSLELARASGDDQAQVDALRARQEACPGPAGRAERLQLASEMAAVARRTGEARTAMWAEVWRVEALTEGGPLSAAEDALAELRIAVQRVGGPVSAWHADRLTACVAQAQGRLDKALDAGRAAVQRMTPVEPAPAMGVYFPLLCALAQHAGVTDEMTPFIEQSVEPLARFRTAARLHRAALLLRAGRADEAAASFRQAGPPARWSLPAFFLLTCYAVAARVAAELALTADLPQLIDRLHAYRGEYVIGGGVAHWGPVELTIGLAAAASGRPDQAVEELDFAVGQAERAEAPGFVAEANYHLALALLARNRPGDRERAHAAAREADRHARALGMAAYTGRARALLSRLTSRGRPGPLSRREAEVAALVAEGLTNREIAQRLVISDRTAENHVQHILTKLGFGTRSQIAAWVAGGAGEYVVE